MTNADASPAPKVDGRRASRERNLHAVVDAMLALFEEGNLDPDAQQIADRSGVSRRSVFRYFDDMETLGRVTIQLMHERLTPYMVPDAEPTNALGTRIAALAHQRAELFERGASAGRVMRLRAPFRPLMQEELDRNRRLLDQQVEAYFQAELDQLDAPSRTEVVAVLQVLYSFETFDSLVARKHTKAASIASIERAVSALFASARS